MHSGNVLRFIKRLALAVTFSALLPGLVGLALCSGQGGESERAHREAAAVRKLPQSSQNATSRHKYVSQPFILFGAWICVLGFMTALPRKQMNYSLPIRG